MLGEVHRGEVTTYGDLSERVFGHRNGGTAIGQMLAKWAADEPEPNLSHRVVDDEGAVPPVGVHRERLEKERVPFDENGRVVLSRCRASLNSRT